MGGSSAPSDQTVTNEPSEILKPYLQDFYGISREILERGPESQFPLFGLAPRSQNTIDAETLALSGLGPSDASQAGINALIASAAPSAGTQAGVQNIYDTLGASDLTLSGLQGALDAAGTQMDLGVSGADTLLAALDPTSAQSQAIINPFIEQLQTDILPSIGSTAVRQGAFGGSRQAVQEQRAAEGVADAATQALLRNQLSALDRLGVAQGGLLTGADTISGVGGALEGIDDQVTADLLRAGGIEEDIAGQSAAALLDAGGLVEDYAAGDIQTLSDVGRQQEGYGQAVLDQLASDYGFDDRALNALIDQFGSRITSGAAGNVQTASGGDGGGGLASLLGLGTALYGLGAFGER